MKLREFLEHPKAELSVRTYNCLSGFTDLLSLDVRRITAAQLLKRKGFGKKNIKELEFYLEELGLRLAADKPAPLKLVVRSKPKKTAKQIINQAKLIAGICARQLDNWTSSKTVLSARTCAQIELIQAVIGGNIEGLPDFDTPVADER